jgi:hypothetical protein
MFHFCKYSGFRCLFKRNCLCSSRMEETSLCISQREAIYLELKMLHISQSFEKSLKSMYTLRLREYFPLQYLFGERLEYHLRDIIGLLLSSMWYFHFHIEFKKLHSSLALNFKLSCESLMMPPWNSKCSLHQTPPMCSGWSHTK